MQEPLSGFITVWSRLVEGSGSHMAWSEAIIERLKGLMLSFASSLQYSLKLCYYTCKSTVWANTSYHSSITTYLFAELCTSSYYIYPTDGLLKDFLDFWFSLTTQCVAVQGEAIYCNSSWCSSVHGFEEKGSKAKSLLKDTIVSLFYQQTGHFRTCWIRCNFPSALWLFLIPGLLSANSSGQISSVI